MTLDPRYIVVSDLQSLFVDKNTGAPLAGGKVTFYKDKARTVKKPVYQLTGNPPDYTYTALPNPCTLGAAGNFVDELGNDIVAYYFPYVSEDDNTVELYYVEVKSSGGQTQFTRQAWPNFVRDDTETQGLINYVPNGQFLLHTNLPETTDYDAGEIRNPITDVAYGGWTFNRPNSSTARDLVTFEFIGTTDSPDANPKYAIRIENESVSVGDAYKDLRLKFSDVNKFASNTQKYTFSFAANTNTGSTLQVQLYLIKNFGTGGSAETETPIAAITIQPSNSISSASFTFGTNEDFTLSEQGDDYIQLVIRFPVQSIFDVQLTDVILTPGEVTISGFPQTPDADFKYKSLAGGITTPNYDSANLYLPVVLGPSGFEYDDSEIGNIRFSTKNEINPKIELNADGAQYETKGYSLYGVPYSRLQAKWWDSTWLVPKWGTGPQYATAVLRTSSNIFGLHANTAGSVTATADGSTATGFTFETVATGNANYYTQAAWLTNTALLLQNLNRGAVTAATVETSTFTITQLRAGSSLLQEITHISCVAASALADPGNPGKYFRFYSYNSGAQAFYVWYQITNEADPAVGGATGIKIKLNASDSANIVAQKTANVLNGWQTSVITANAASTVAAGSYWIFNSTTTGYYVWYKKDGAGTDPAPASRTGIKVDILAADTNVQVAAKTITEINKKYFAVPDFRGMSLQALDPNQVIDKDFRWSLVDNITGMRTGTFQYDANISHRHTAEDDGTFITDNIPGGLDVPGGGSLTEQRRNTAFDGSYNTRARNAVANFYVRY